MNVSFPVVVDTEFRTRVTSHSINPFETRKRITTQVRGINDPTGLIMASPELKYPRHPVATSGFHPVDYLRLMGHDVCLERCEHFDYGYPTFEVVMYGHFLVAEVLTIVDGSFKKDFKDLLRAKPTSDVCFSMQRRLMAVQKIKTKTGGTITNDSVPMPWLLTIDGLKYQVKVCWMDSCAVHGTVSYSEFCEAAGIELESKNVWKNGEITRMDEMYRKRPEDYDAYALGDLEVYNALEANSENFRQVYMALGIEELFTPPALTIGSTVRKMFADVLKYKLGLEKDYKAFSKTYLKTVSASHLKIDGLSTKALLAKVEGGRCRNNRPTDVNIVSPLVDMDISGCYGEGQRNQVYPIGKPEILFWDAKSAFNKYWSLREFLEKHMAGTTPEGWKIDKGDLVSGCWSARVSTFEPLNNQQDYLASWFVNGKSDIDLLAKYVQLDMQSDSEKSDNEFNVDDGQLKVFNNEIKNGLITHDFIDWLMFIASPRQRKELLDGLHVTASIVYPASTRVENIYEFNTVNKEWTGQNVQNRLGKLDGECHAWFSYGMGPLLINTLLANRKLHKKKTPLNTLFKLNVNTLYGDMVSKFFDEANVVVGNNITARARAVAYYMEKGLYGFQTVTDGCTFELNNVLRSFGKTGGIGETVNLHRKDTRKRNIRLGSIIPDGSEVSLTWVELSHLDGDKVITKKYPRIAFGHSVYEPFVTEDGDDVVVPAMAWINRAAMQHLQDLFPDVDVLHGKASSLKPLKNPDGTAGYSTEPRKGQFEFEAKQFYDKGTFQGSANYLLTNPNKCDDNLKMRSYEAKKNHVGFVNNEDTDRYTNDNNPANDFMRGLAKDANNVERQIPFIKEGILKVSDYKLHSSKHDKNGIEPGDSFLKPGMLKEFSISQFTFKTLAQFKAWEKAVTLRKDKYGQSLEFFFLNEDGTVDVEKMAKTVDALIEEGCMDPFKALEKRKNIAIDPHPGNEDYKLIKGRFNQ